MAITLQDALQRTIEHREIFHDEMLSLMRRIMGGEVSPVMIAALTVELRVKKETIGEIAAAAQVMREFATKVEVADSANLLDIVGTGGDASHTFNISTASMFVAAAAGARVAKHGNRSVSSKSGSADVLEALGANIMLSPPQVAESIDKTGVGFMFAPSHHGAMKHAAPAMKATGGGAIVALSSIAGVIGFPAMAPYIASKHAVFGLVKVAAAELGPSNIRVNAVAPGPIDNRMTLSLAEQLGGGDPQGFRSFVEGRIPMGRYGTNEEIAHLIAFLSSDAASYCSGGLYLSDGGYVAL